MALIGKLAVAVDAMLDIVPMDRNESRRRKERNMRLRIKEKKIATEKICFDQDVFNVAVCGPSKSGKSRLISTICSKLQSSSARSHENPPNGRSDDPSKKVVANRRITFWEKPGSGKVGSTGDYFWTNNLVIYDLAVILTGEMVREEELRLASQLEQFSIPCAFVRSKCDRDLRQNADDEQMSITQVKPNFYRKTLSSYLNEMAAFTGDRFRSAFCFLVSAKCLETDNDDLELDDAHLLGFLWRMADPRPLRRTCSQLYMCLHEADRIQSDLVRRWASDSKLMSVDDDHYSVSDADMLNRGILLL